MIPKIFGMIHVDHSPTVYAFILIVCCGVFAQWVAWKSRIPAIALLCLTGVVLGPVSGVLHPEETLGDFVEVIVKFAVAFILFDGGLNLRRYELRTAGEFVKRLVVFGLPLSFVLGSIAGLYIGGLSPETAIVLGAILVVTGPTVIIPLIRQSKLNEEAASILKWEGIVNDPLGALLAVMCLELFVAISSGQNVSAIFVDFAFGIIISAALGFFLGLLIQSLFNNHLVPEFLKIPSIFCAIIVSFGISNMVQSESGLLAVTLLGYVIGNSELRIIDELRRFKEQIAVFLVSAVFIILTADLDPGIIEKINSRTLALVLCFLFIVRPVSIFISTAGIRAKWQQKLLIGWIAPRGIVAASVAGLFAPALIEAGVSDADLLVPIVFMVIFATILSHGFTLHSLARVLKLSKSLDRSRVIIVGATDFSMGFAKVLKSLKIPVTIFENSWFRMQSARNQGLKTKYQEILSDTIEEDIDFANFTHLIAMTSNDSYNSFVCSNFAHILGETNIFQLNSQSHERDEIGAKKKGRVLFNPPLHYNELEKRLKMGWKFEVMNVTDNNEVTPVKTETSFPVALVRDKYTLHMYTKDSSPNRESGDILIWVRAQD
jgi:NhaP-type Na+/H+ or K+/H+ antiporter